MGWGGEQVPTKRSNRRKAPRGEEARPGEPRAAFALDSSPPRSSPTRRRAPFFPGSLPATSPAASCNAVPVIRLSPLVRGERETLL